jgi:hypothetical protein
MGGADRLRGELVGTAFVSPHEVKSSLTIIFPCRRMSQLIHPSVSYICTAPYIYQREREID